MGEALSNLALRPQLLIEWHAHEEERVRKWAADALNKTLAKSLRPHVDGIAALLEQPAGAAQQRHVGVQLAALKTLRKLPPVTFREHAALIAGVATVAGSSAESGVDAADMRHLLEAALTTLRLLQPLLSNEQLVVCLDHAVEEVRRFAIEALGQSESGPEMLLSMYEQRDELREQLPLEQVLPPQTLVSWLGSKVPNVRFSSANLLAQLSTTDGSPALLPFVGPMVGHLAHTSRLESDSRVREVVLVKLGDLCTGEHLGPAQLVRHAEAIASLLADPKTFEAAEQLLTQMRPQLGRGRLIEMQRHFKYEPEARRWIEAALGGGSTSAASTTDTPLAASVPPEIVFLCTSADGDVGPSAFMIFSNETRDRILKEHPNCTHGEAESYLVKAWTDVYDGDKTRYQRQAADDKVKNLRALLARPSFFNKEAAAPYDYERICAQMERILVGHASIRSSPAPRAGARRLTSQVMRGNTTRSSLDDSRSVQSPKRNVVSDSLAPGHDSKRGLAVLLVERMPRVLQTKVVSRLAEGARRAHGDDNAQEYIQVLCSLPPALLSLEDESFGAILKVLDSTSFALLRNLHPVALAEHATAIAQQLIPSSERVAEKRGTSERLSERQAAIFRLTAPQTQGRMWFSVRRRRRRLNHTRPSHVRWRTQINAH